MQAVEPVGGPWPHDMVISSEANPAPLTDLLYARAVWDLPVGADVPPLAQAPIERLQPPADTSALASGWELTWEEALAFAAGSDQRRLGLNELVPDVSALSDAQVLAAFTPPVWEPLERLDRNGIYQWQQTLPKYHDRPLGQHPERRSVTDVVAAWQRGLTTLVVIPVEGGYARQVSEHAMLLSHHAYEDQATFEAALCDFGGPA